tara:strand:+ start:130 stop:564 length:435 start_codon:yes stop_codon:yes gene_type:complete
MSTVVLDTITGKSTATTITIGSTPVVSASANSMTIRGEGSNQTSIQQGLCKSWCEVDSASTPASEASFNVASITDSGTGEPSPQMTTALSSAQGVVVANNNESASGFEPNANLTAAGAYRSIMRNSSNTLVDEAVSLAVFGSLA